ncbi:hypothetical protein LOZ39_003990 [Ophidiomyces ophidiicola]|nr:hypothetical protein LOZ45_004825 [Ophidiomyces ophidiicola]KAI2048978.1 hypothetical protein LOZ38_004073 [Ophidiomyces ophidiicola]KAI2073496.1 hypothetical protein LOZ39_003990 [Ophidiomyces ophidiicola]KAI2076164.1 hypothetical protein LOZ37_003251 [Ophidiomyces ophidiicola]KAI2088598.1 hypothetical protein LOZ36_002195 [Ophidiomyces ophidiicola]
MAAYDTKNSLNSGEYRDRFTSSTVDNNIAYQQPPSPPPPPHSPSSSRSDAPPSPGPPPFSSLYFSPEPGPKDTVTESPVPGVLAFASTASREERPASHSLATTSSVIADTKAALSKDTRGESSGKSRDDAEPPPPYTEGSSPLLSFSYVMAAAGGAASIITQVQQTGGPPLNTLGDVGGDENITLDLRFVPFVPHMFLVFPVRYDVDSIAHRGTRFTLSRDELLTLPEFVLLSLFPNGLLPDSHMGAFNEGDVYSVDYDPTSLQYMLEFFRSVAQSIPSPTPSPTTSPDADPLESLQNSQRDMLQDRAGIIVLREDLDFYAIPPNSEVEHPEMMDIKRAAGKALLKQDGIFSGLRKTDEAGTTEQHLIEMLTAGGFNHDDCWGHRAAEPNKAVVCSLALARLRTDIRGDLNGNNAVGMAQKLLLFWRKPARRCWWEGVELENVDGVEGKLKVWIRRVWTLEMYANALLIPVLPATQVPTVRTTKRGTTAINYAEDDGDDDTWDDGDRNRPTGLRSMKREEIHPDRGPTGEKLGTEIYAPANVQPNFRDWAIRRRPKSTKEVQSARFGLLPSNLVPIRIDLEIPSHQPVEPFPLPRNYLELGINPTAPAYRKPEAAPPYRLKDFILWNLHEPYVTPEEYALSFVRELDLPSLPAMVSAVCTQIRQQLEEYAGVAMHPIFQKTTTSGESNRLPSHTNYDLDSPTPVRIPPTTPVQLDDANKKQTISQGLPPSDNLFNTDDAYRCIVTLDITLQNRLYTDKFEWSLLHDQGMADVFARVTCADLGLGPEWVNVISHGICETVLKLKKEACESGGLVGIGGDGVEIDNQTANGKEAGWRYDPDGLGDEWEPRVQFLSKEDIEKREGDRERQIRRLRRETARFSSTAGMSLELTRHTAGGYFDLPDPDTPMGRGERNKRRRRARSNSPASGTPGGRGTPDIGGAVAGYGGGGGTLTDM